MIAQKLKIRYGERLKLWKYEADLYETYLSEVELSDRRMKKLEQVSVQELQEIEGKRCIRNEDRHIRKA